MSDLSPCEHRILRHILGGYSDKETARLLGVSDRTVQTHRLNIRRKLKTQSKRDLILFAREHGIQAV